VCGNASRIPRGAAAIVLPITHRASRKSSFAYAPNLALGALVMLLASAPA